MVRFSCFFFQIVQTPKNITLTVIEDTENQKYSHLRSRNQWTFEWLILIFLLSRNGVSHDVTDSVFVIWSGLQTQFFFSTAVSNYSVRDEWSCIELNWTEPQTLCVNRYPELTRQSWPPLWLKPKHNNSLMHLKWWNRHSWSPEDKAGWLD